MASKRWWVHYPRSSYHTVAKNGSAEFIEKREVIGVYISDFNSKFVFILVAESNQGPKPLVVCVIRPNRLQKLIDVRAANGRVLNKWKMVEVRFGSPTIGKIALEPLIISGRQFAPQFCLNELSNAVIEW